MPVTQSHKGRTLSVLYSWVPCRGTDTALNSNEKRAAVGACRSAAWPFSSCGSCRPAAVLADAALMPDTSTGWAKVTCGCVHRGPELRHPRLNSPKLGELRGEGCRAMGHKTRWGSIAGHRCNTHLCRHLSIQLVRQ